jgi:hypothetical protein
MIRILLGALLAASIQLSGAVLGTDNSFVSIVPSSVLVPTVYNVGFVKKKPAYECSKSLERFLVNSFSYNDFDQVSNTIDPIHLAKVINFGTDGN